MSLMGTNKNKYKLTDLTKKKKKKKKVPFCDEIFAVGSQGDQLCFFVLFLRNHQTLAMIFEPKKMMKNTDIAWVIPQSQ